jgi:2-oxoisovalerate dehydrogenase E2 component (dihydrolipoyl transacylase)
MMMFANLLDRFVKPGSVISQFDKICEVQSDKATVEITSRYDGVVKRLYYNVGDLAKVGQPLIEIATAGETETVETKAPPPPPPSPSPSQPTASSTPTIDNTSTFTSNGVLATPAVRRIAREHHIDLRTVTGTGKQGRITKEDVLRHLSATTSSATTSTPTAIPVATPTEGDFEQPLTTLQRAMFKSMTRSLTIPHFGYADEVIMDQCNELRASINRHLMHRSNLTGTSVQKITFMPIMIKALSLALKEYPLLNACIVDADDPNKARLRYRASHNIGVAMDTPAGLIVPNIKRVQDLSILEIAAELQRLQEAGRTNSISLSDLKDGTITLSNIGMIGGTYLSPVLVSTELCIGAIGKIRRLPRFVTETDPTTGQSTEKVVAQSVMNVSWSADHRVVDGATMARFSETWKQMLEQPAMLLAKLS